MIHKKVKFNDEIYWLHEVEYFGFSLSPLNHYNDEGNLLANPLVDISYAFVLNGKIMRFGREIGLESDLVEV